MRDSLSITHAVLTGGDHLLPFELVACTLSLGFGAGAFAWLVASTDVPRAIVSLRRDVLGPIPSLVLPNFDEPNVSRQRFLRQLAPCSYGDDELGSSEPYDLAVDIHPAWLAALARDDVDDARVLGTLAVLDVVFDLQPTQPASVELPDAVLGWAPVSAAVRERLCRLDPSRLAPWERGESEAPPPRWVDDDGIHHLLAYTSKTESHYYSSGWSSRVSRLQLSVGRNAWSLRRTHLWQHIEAGLEYS